MPWLAAPPGRSAAACRPSPTWYKPVMTEFEEFLAVVCLHGRGCGPGEIGEVGELAGLGDVADDGEGEGAGRGRHRAEGALMSSAPDVIVSGRRPRQAHRRGTLAARPPATRPSLVTEA